jgi:hypothetical protein
MEAEEKEELEKTISNHILNTMHFSDMFNLVSEEAKRRSKEIIGESSDEQLLKMQRDITEWQTKVLSYVETRAHGEKFQKAGWGGAGSRPKNWTPAED